MRGGTGETFDWQLVRERRSKVPLILSGGLTAENVAQAIAVARPFAVDTASGTEAAPGHKDPAKLDAFFRAVGPTPAQASIGPTA
jgi:phosphoribosylanthranilate isomerase